MNDINPERLAIARQRYRLKNLTSKSVYYWAIAISSHQIGNQV
ncbi:hypothetical protein [Chroococcidiopsis sp. SAG 2025]|nr:hypothetical protein [Chroococcidiopsis sp. SAG 2025]